MLAPLLLLTELQKNSSSLAHNRHYLTEAVVQSHYLVTATRIVACLAVVA
jgi:hypothetical protein